MNTSAHSEVARFDERTQQLRAKGLSDLKFYPGLVSEASPEDFAREANILLDTVQSGQFEPLIFNDTPAAKAQ